MSYLVLARKWRPQTFEEVVGQNHAVTTLRNAIASNRVAHAYLFSGPRGVGKTSLARILAKAMNCDQGPCPQPCQRCTHCLEITQGTSLDVFEIDGASNRGIDEIRELKQNIQYLPATGRYKIYIIDEVHMLTKEAFNALLKTLEEPPKHVIFVLATTEAHKVPVTILSRCQRFDFRRVSSSDIAGQLERIADQEGIQTESKALMSIAREADGSMRDALSLMDQILSYSPERITYETVLEVLGLVDRGMVLKLLERIISGDMAAIVETVDRVHMGGYDFKQFYKNILEELRTLLYFQLSPDTRESSAPIDEERRQREKILSLTSHRWLLAAMNQLLGVDAELRYASYPRFVMELALLKLAHLNEFLALDQLLMEVEAHPPRAQTLSLLKPGNRLPRNL
jgi:DNA polymerase-3 subunit gamma/tau